MEAPYILTYDISQVSGMENPSYILRRVGFRLSESSWVIRAENMHEIYHLLCRFRTYNIVWSSIQVDIKENGKLLKMAVEAFKAQIKEYVTSGMRSVGRANNELGNDRETPTDAMKKHRAKCVAITKRIGRVMKDVKEAAAKFNVEEDQLNLTATLQDMDVIKNTMMRRCKVFLDSIAELERYAGSADPMVKAARAGKVPANILADYMDDRDLRKTKRLRSVFGC